MTSRIGRYVKRNQQPQKVKMEFTVSPEMLREQGIETKESVPVTMEVTLPKDIKEVKK